jgi:hypothetical protein
MTGSLLAHEGMSQFAEFVIDWWYEFFECL